MRSNGKVGLTEVSKYEQKIKYHHSLKAVTLSLVSAAIFGIFIAFFMEFIEKTRKDIAL